MPAQDDMREAMLAAVPNLRAFAVSLCGDMDRANDLVHRVRVRDRLQRRAGLDLVENGRGRESDRWHVPRMTA